MSNPQKVLVTGANTGIGFAIVRALHASPIPYTIYLGCRTPAKATAAIETLQNAHPKSASTLHPLQIDLESDSSITTAATTLATALPHLDILINNAGGNFESAAAKGKISPRECWNKSWDVNVTGTHIVTAAFASMLLKSPHGGRLIFTSSGLASLAESGIMEGAVAALNGSPEKGWPKEPTPTRPMVVAMSYRASKTGLNMLMREWYRLLFNDGVKVWAYEPGFLATGLGDLGEEHLRQMGAGEPSEGGELMQEIVEGKWDEDVGKVVRKGGCQPW